MKHHTECWRDEGHPACRLAEILRLQSELRRYTDGGFRYASANVTWGAPCSDVATDPADLAGATLPLAHDHIDPVIHAGAPTWAAHHDSPPSFTP